MESLLISKIGRSISACRRFCLRRRPIALILKFFFVQMKIKTRTRQVIQFNYSPVTVNKQIPKVLHFFGPLIDLTDLTFHVLPRKMSKCWNFKEIPFLLAKFADLILAELSSRCSAAVRYLVDELTHESEIWCWGICDFPDNLIRVFKCDVMSSENGLWIGRDWPRILSSLVEWQTSWEIWFDATLLTSVDLCELNAFHKTREKLQRSYETRWWKLFDPRRCKLHHIKCWDMLLWVDLRNFRFQFKIIHIVCRYSSGMLHVEKKMWVKCVERAEKFWSIYIKWNWKVRSCVLLCLKHM